MSLPVNRQAKRSVASRFTRQTNKKNEKNMQIKLFTVPVGLVNQFNDEINSFLRSHKVVDYQKKLVEHAEGVFWCFYFSYVHDDFKEYTQKEKIDYMKVLDEKAFKVFSKLRDWRRKISAEEGVAAFVVFTDAELAEISKLPEINCNAMKTIKGISQKKIEKYGELIVKTILEPTHETDREPGFSDSLF